MKTVDKFLISIVGGVILLVVAAFVVVLLRPRPTYQSEDTPEAVAHNYLLALKQKDYARAYTYLSPAIPGYPDSSEDFAEDIRDNSWLFNNGNDSATLEVESADITGSRAIVSVRETVFYAGGLFDSSQYSNIFEITLEQDTTTGVWKIVESDSYWAWCWNERGGCR